MKAAALALARESRLFFERNSGEDAKMSIYLDLGQGDSVAAIGGAEALTDARHALTETDRDEFDREPAARFLIREMDSDEFAYFSSPARTIRRGAKPLVIVFKSGHRRYFVACAGWLALSRCIRNATQTVEAQPDLAGDAVSNTTPSCLYDAAMAADDNLSAQVSPLVSDFIYVDAPGFMSFGIFGARIYRGFDAATLSPAWRHWIGLYQRQIDDRRRFDRSRLRSYDGPFVFPRGLLTTARRRRRAN